MSGDDLKSKLAAKVQASHAKKVADEEVTRKYHATLIREYPRLCQQLLDRVTALVGGVDGVTINSEIHSEELAYLHGSTSSGFTTTKVGTVRVPTFGVSIGGVLKVVFRPDGTNVVGAYGSILVESSKLPETRILMQSTKDDKENWVLAVRNKATFGQWWTELSDDALSALLEQALL